MYDMLLWGFLGFMWIALHILLFKTSTQLRDIRNRNRNNELRHLRRGL